MRGPAGTPQGRPVPVGPVGRSASVGPSGRRAPLAVALDAPDAATAVRWARSVTPHVAMLKVGLELFYREGPAVIVALRAAGALADPAGAGLDGREPPSSGALPELFLDLKLHDIPATVAGGIRSVTPLRPRFVTVHASGGSTMIRAAVEAAGEAASAAGGGAGDSAGADAGDGVWTGPSIAAVTVLTSLSGADLTAVGLAGPALAAVLRLAELAVAAGATALVCSPSEVSEVRRVVGASVTLITPGVRPRGSAWADQSRVATPGEAVAAGADLVVVGRPITGAADPGVAAAAVAAELVRPR